jgi:hypothetical protein
VTIHSDPVTVRALTYEAIFERVSARLLQSEPTPDDERRARTQRIRRFVAGAQHRVAAFIPSGN